MLRFLKKASRIVVRSSFYYIPQEEDVTFAHSAAYFFLHLRQIKTQKCETRGAQCLRNNRKSRKEEKYILTCDKRKEEPDERK